MVLISLHFPYARVEYKSALIYDNVFIGLRIRYRWAMNTLSFFLLSDITFYRFYFTLLVYSKVNLLFSVMLFEALPTRASNSPFSDFHELVVSS